MTGSTAAIQAEHLVKRYGSERVVDDLSFSVASGEVFALLGPNGAGKTTTVEILEGYRRADAGSVRVLGLDPRRDGARLKQRMGLMLQQGGIYTGITAEEMLHLFARFYAKPAEPEALLALVGLTSARATRFRRLSGGQQRRLALAVALIGQPDVVFLDEPTAGMDPQARLLTWDLIRGLAKRGATVLLTTHLMDEAERLADHVGIIDHGRLVALDTPRQLLQRRQAAAVTLRVALQAPVEARALLALPGVQAVRDEGNAVYRIDVADPAAAAATIAAWLRDVGANLAELRVGSASLEELFLQLTGRELRE
jgi:ABC-2 type transport system ATP-binding protein